MPKLYISMLGEFSLSYEGRVISERTRRSEKTWMFLQYLICFKDRNIPTDELIAVLWGEEEIENPKSALKTQMHRLRTELDKLEVSESIIVSARGSYTFNKALDFSFDVEEFDRFCALALRENNPQSKINHVTEAIRLYKGDFLPKLRRLPWTNGIRERLRSLYIEVMRDTLEFLMKNNRPHDIITLCERGILADPYNEFLHETLIRAFAVSGNNHSARTHYNYTLSLLNEKYSKVPSGIQKRFDDALKYSAGDSYGFEDILDGLSEDAVFNANGAFYCEYEFFKQIYRLEMRYIERYKKINSVFLVTLVGRNGGDPVPETLTEDMERLDSIINSSLRISDVYAKYSVSQYIIMLHNTSAEDCPPIVERLTRNYLNCCPPGANLPKSEYQPLDSIK